MRTNVYISENHTIASPTHKQSTTHISLASTLEVVFTKILASLLRDLVTGQDSLFRFGNDPLHHGPHAFLNGLVEQRKSVTLGQTEAFPKLLKRLTELRPDDTGNAHGFLDALAVLGTKHLGVGLVRVLLFELEELAQSIQRHDLFLCGDASWGLYVHEDVCVCDSRSE